MAADKSKNIVAEKLRIAMVKKNDMKFTQLAKLINTSSTNLNNKFKRNDFCESDFREIADALGYDVEIILTSRETGEKL